MDAITEVPRIVSADSEVSRCWGWDRWDREHRVWTFKPDEKDQELLDARQAARAARTEVLEGDYVEFADGVRRRVSDAWEGGVQTSDGGSWYLTPSGAGQFSGSLFRPVKPATLTDTGRVEPGRFWFFHRDFATAHHAVHVDVNVRVWTCSVAAPR